MNNYYNNNDLHKPNICLESLTVSMRNENEYCYYIKNKVLYNNINLTMLTDTYRPTDFSNVLIFENQLNQLHKLNLHYLKIQVCTIEYVYIIMKSRFIIDILELDVVFHLQDLCNINKKSINCKIHTLKLDSDKVTLELDHLLHIRKHICENVFYTKRMCNRNLSSLSPNAITLYEYIRDNPKCWKTSIYNAFRNQLQTTIISALDSLTVQKLILCDSDKYYNVITKPYKKDEEREETVNIEDEEMPRTKKKARTFYDSDEEDL